MGDVSLCGIFNFQGIWKVEKIIIVELIALTINLLEVYILMAKEKKVQPFFISLHPLYISVKGIIFVSIKGQSNNTK